MPNQDGLSFLFDITDKLTPKLAKIEKKVKAARKNIDKAFTGSSKSQQANFIKFAAIEQKRVAAAQSNATKLVGIASREAATAKRIADAKIKAEVRVEAAKKKALERSLARIKRESEAFKRSMTRLASAAAVAFAAVAGKALQMAGGYDAAMRSVQAKTGATGAVLDKLSDQAREMGRTTVHSATEAARGQAFLAQAGFDANEILSALPATLALATAGELDLASAADITSNVLSGFQLATIETGRVADVLALAASKTNTSVLQLGSALAKAAPAAKAAGWSIEETTAAIGKLSDAGIQGEEAGTTLNTMLAKLSINGGPAEKLLHKMGITVKDTAGRMLPLNDILSELAPHADDVGLQMALLGTRGAKAGFILGAVAQDARKLTGELENAGGTAQAMADIMGGGLWGTLKSIGSVIDDAYISFGEKLAPALQVGLDLFRKLPDPIRTTTIIVGSLVGAMGGLMLIMPQSFGALVKFPGKLIGLAKSIKDVTVVQWLMNAAMTANPIGLIVAAVALLVGGLYLLYTKTEIGREALTAIAHVAKVIFSTAINLAWAAIKWLAKWAEIAKNKIMGMIPDWVIKSVEWLGKEVAVVTGEIAEFNQRQDASAKVQRAAADAAAKLTEEQEAAAETVARVTAEITGFNQSMEENAKEQIEAADAALELAKEQEKAAEAAAKLAKQHAVATEVALNLAKEHKVSAEVVEILAQEHEVATEVAEQLAREHVVATKVAEKLTEEHENAADAGENLAKEHENAAKVEEKIAKKQEKLAKARIKTEKEWITTQKRAKTSTKDLARVVRELDEWMEELRKEEERLLKAAEDLNDRLEDQRRHLLGLPTDEAKRDFEELIQTWDELTEAERQNAEVLERFKEELEKAAAAGMELDASQLAIIESTKTAEASASGYELALAGMAGAMGGATGKALNLVIAMQAHNEEQRLAVEAGKASEVQFTKTQIAAGNAAVAFAAAGTAVGGTAGQILGELSKVSTAFATGDTPAAIRQGIISGVSIISGLFSKKKRKRKAREAEAKKERERIAAEEKAYWDNVYDSAIGAFSRATEAGVTAYEKVYEASIESSKAITEGQKQAMEEQLEAAILAGDTQLAAKLKVHLFLRLYDKETGVAHEKAIEKATAAQLAANDKILIAEGEKFARMAAFEAALEAIRSGNSAGAAEAAAKAAAETRTAWVTALVAVEDADKATTAAMIDNSGKLTSAVIADAREARKEQVAAAADAASRWGDIGRYGRFGGFDFSNPSLAGVAPPGRKHGGPVRAGRPYTVGERGPEMFIPSRSGRIKTHGSSGGGVDAKEIGQAVKDALKGLEINVDGRKFGRLTVRHQPLASVEIGGRR